MHNHRNGRNAYRRDVRSWNVWQPDRAANGNFATEQDCEEGDSPETSASKGTYAAGGGTNGLLDRAGAGTTFGNGETRPSQPTNTSSPQAGVSDIEKRLSSMQQDFTHALQKVGEKENEKFDLIFAILVELQSRQAQLEESVRALNVQFGTPGSGGQLSSSATSPASVSLPSQHTQNVQFSGSSGGHQSYSQLAGQIGGQLNGQMNSNMNSQQPMQQFAGVMQADASQAMFTAVPQVVVVASPSATGLQYAMPQMMSPTGAMQPMQMQYMGQGPAAELGGAGNTARGSEQQANVGESPAPPQAQQQHLQGLQQQQPQQLQQQSQQQQSSQPQLLQVHTEGTDTGNESLACSAQHGAVKQQLQQAEHGSLQPAASPE